MSREIRIYFEGDKSLKAGFDAFFKEIGERARVAQHQIRIVATGGTPERDFGIAPRKHPAAWNILLRATKDTTKGKYHKTKHAPALLQSIKPALVRKAAPNCERLFRLVLDHLE